MSRVDTIVVGAGLSGLACAYYLQKQGQSVAVFEGGVRVGGVLQNFTIDGIHLELGANSFLLRDELKSLIAELNVELVEASKYSTLRFLCLEDGQHYKLVAAPSSVWQLPFTKLLSPAGKLRLLWEPFAHGEKKEDQSVDDFLSARFGKEFASRIVATALNGVYAADTKNLSARSALPSLWEIYQKYGSLIKGIIFKAPRGPKRGKSKIVRFVGGMEKLPEALANSLSEAVKLNHRVADIIPEKGVRLETGEIVEAANIVIACEAQGAAGLLKNSDSKLSAAISAIPYAPLGMLYLIGSSGDHTEPVEGVGFLKQPKKGYSLLGVLYSSSLFPGECKTKVDQVLLTCFVGGMLNPHLSDVTNRAIGDLAFEEVKTILGLGPSFKVLHTHYWPKAIPSYPIGHFDLAKKVKELETKRIFVAANWLEKPGLPDCIIRAKEIAERIVS